MSKQESIKQVGTVEEALPDAKFRVKSVNGLSILVSLSGKMRKNYIKILLGDVVDVEVSPYDLHRGRIVFRHPRKMIDTTS